MAEKIRDEIHAFQKIEELERRVEELESSVESTSLQSEDEDDNATD